ncbi:GyrI-like domain-containing protein [Lachnoclostridium sp. An76]|uniref:GyrI-like domain-containing protein n=1 Tax=Lachnoclostridium sp. An76 TaxID=1965654 RepID=UPI000B39B64C|nr:GyrI-like domain-containing protein [Lachnoclostridium sp. An76]OUN33794.1 transcriptional regulator [Lachnoclostridium sp. An76]
MTFDYKKGYKEFYLPPKVPGIAEIPTMNYVAVRGKGNPNDPDREYKRAMSLLYGISFTIKMSYKGSHRIEGYFPYVVPPLEGLWWQDGISGIDYAHKDSFQWISMIRLPEFVTKEEFDWAVREAETKKQTDFSRAEFFTYNEGLCVQCMHIGSYDDEPATLRKMEAFLSENGYQPDFSGERLHHEIYLSDPRRTAPERLKTVIRQPIKRI